MKDALIDGLPFIVFFLFMLTVLGIVLLGMSLEQNAIVKCVEAGGNPLECEEAL